MINQDDSFFGKPIYIYSRTQALKDGTLVDITQMAKKAGFKVPVAVSSIVWDKYIVWTNADNQQQTYQNQTGRSWDMLWMLYLACKRNTDKPNLKFRLYVIPRDGRSKKPHLIELKAVMDGGDNGEPVMTILLLNEN